MNQGFPYQIKINLNLKYHCVVLCAKIFYLFPNTVSLLFVNSLRFSRKFLKCFERMKVIKINQNF